MFKISEHSSKNMVPQELPNVTIDFNKTMKVLEANFIFYAKYVWQKYETNYINWVSMRLIFNRKIRWRGC
jgi:hypothetical protein